MAQTQVDLDFIKVRDTIDSINKISQIESCEKLIELFYKKHYNEDLLDDEEDSLNCSNKTLIEHLNLKKIKFGS